MPSVSDKAIQSLSALPFHDIIAGPLNACIEAQSQAAVSTVNFIKDVGLNTTEDEAGNETSEAVYVYFSFISGGRKVNISVPLLSIVPIPYIAINTIDIAFKATVTGMDKTSSENSSSYEKQTQEESSSQKGLGILRKKKTSKMTSTISSKRDSKSMQESSYSIEATIDVNVHATQDSMPAGMAKVLELLNSSVDLCSPIGELTISETQLYLKKDETAYVTISYKSPEGLLEPEKITIKGAAANDKKTQNGMVVLTVKGSGDNKTYDVEVTGNSKLDKMSIVVTNVA